MSETQDTERVASNQEPRLERRPINDVKPRSDNPRIHTARQIKGIAKGIEELGDNSPITVDRNGYIVAGHGRLEAHKRLGHTHVWVVCLPHLTEAQARAHMVGDNKHTDNSNFDPGKLKSVVKTVIETDVTIDPEAFGFATPEIDFLLLPDPANLDALDQFEITERTAVTVAGDLWQLGDHRLLCGDALQTSSYQTILALEKAAAVITDPPYNRRMADISGNGATSHREFAMASGEMSDTQFTEFLSKPLSLVSKFSKDGALCFTFMDWRHLHNILAAGQSSGLSLINFVVWVKAHRGLGSFLGSQHELLPVFKIGAAPSVNNVMLGAHGRNRSNVWFHPGANSFPRKGTKRGTEFHPTAKPVALIADAILDCTHRRDVVLDPFLGAGSTLLAAESTQRRCFGIEIDPGFVDVTIVRWQRMTGKLALDQQGRTYAEAAAERGVAR